MIVVDSSALADYLVGSRHAPWVESQLHAAGWHLHAPHLVDVEIASALRRLQLAGVLPARRGKLLLDLLAELPLVRYPHQQLLERVWELRTHVTAQDAMYAALAEALNASLVTTDLRLARAHGIRTTIIAP